MGEVKNSIEFFKHSNAQYILVESDSPKERKEIWRNCTVLNISKGMKELEIFIKENCNLSLTMHLKMFFPKEWILPFKVEGKIQGVEKWRDGYVASVELTKFLDLDKFTNREHFSENIDEKLQRLIEERERLISIGGDKYIRKYVNKFGETKGDSDSLGEKRREERALVLKTNFIC